jgi:hypothetical protein
VPNLPSIKSILKHYKFQRQDGAVKEGKRNKKEEKNVLSEMKFERMETGRETQGAKSKSMRRAAKKEGTPKKNTHRARVAFMYTCMCTQCEIFLLFV